MRLWWLSLMAFLLLQGIALADDDDEKPVPYYMTGSFSDVGCVPSESDMLGTEIRISFGKGQYWVLFQDFGGEVSAPVLVKAEVAGDQISFVIPGDPSIGSSAQAYQLWVRPTALVGLTWLSSDGGQGNSGARKEGFALPRGPSIWERLKGDHLEGCPVIKSAK